MQIQANRNINRHPRYYLALGLLMAIVLLTGGVLLSLTQRIDESQDLRRSAQVVTGQPQLLIAAVEAEVGREAVLPITVKNFRNITAADITVMFNGGRVAIEPNKTHSNIPGLVINRREVVTASGATGLRYQVTHPSGISLPDDTILFSVHFTPSGAGTITTTIDSRSVITTTESAGQNVLTSRTPATLTVIASRGSTTPACIAPSILVPPGVVPYEQFLNPGGANGVSYEVDFEGTGTWVPYSTTTPTAHTYNTARVYNPKFRVVGTNNVNSVICNYPFSVLVYGTQNEIPTGAMDQYQESGRQRTSATDTPGSDDDLFLANVQDGIYDGSTKMDAEDLEVGEGYRYKITALVQNTKKVANSTNNTSVTIRLNANDSGSDTFIFSYGELQRTAAGLSFTLETPFVVDAETKIETLADSEKVIAEYNEQNNERQIDIEFEADKSTTQTDSVTFANTCNKYCADASECSFGLSCQNNRCRHPQNIASETCVGPNSTRPGCNMTCQSSADCAAGLMCSNGSCRNPSNPGSVTCAARSTASAGIGGVGRATPTPTPRPTISPTAGPSTKPVATIKPVPTPPIFSATGSGVLNATPSAPLVIIPMDDAEPTPPPADTTVADDFMSWFNGLGLPAGVTIGTLLVAGGIGLLLIVLLIAILRSRKSKSTYLEPLPATKPVTSFTPMPGVLQKGVAPTTHNPPPAPAITVPGKDNAVTLLPGQRPQVAQQTPQAGPLATQSPPTGNNTSSSMVQRLQEKGITLDK